MNKIFLLEHHAKTSEDCNKYSTSVSYETLVGGTTTAGSAYEQTQCLSKGRAGYRFCKTMRFSNENLVDRLLQTLPVFRLVKVLALAAVLSMGIISESRAESTCPYGENRCGPNCCYSVDINNNLNIRALTSIDIGYDSTDDRGKASVAEGQFSTEYGHTEVYNDVIFNGNFDTIGHRAFRSREMTVVDKKDHGVISGNVIFNGNVKVIGELAFADNHLSSFEIPDSVTKLGAYALGNNRIDKITIPDNVTAIDERAFYANPSLQSVTLTDSITQMGKYAFDDYQSIICKGANCADVQRLLHESGYNGNFSFADEKQCTGNFYWSGSSCNNKKNGIKCAENWKQIETWCNRIRYTPAEAAKVLKDTDNEIVMTFKVSR